MSIMTMIRMIMIMILVDSLSWAILVSYHDEVRSVDAVMEDGADDAGPDDETVLELVDPALVDDGDDPDDVSAVYGAEDHVLEALGGLDDGEDYGIGQGAEEGDGQGAQEEGGHDQVAEDRDQGRDVRGNLGLDIVTPHSEK